jgi:CubicO group peptidase (beta-lactamase class C family)
MRALILSSLVLCGCATSQLPAISRIERGSTPDAAITEQLRLHHAPALSVAVIADYQLVWAKAWGLVDTQTQFQAASVSKLVTALAALLAVEQGKLSLDADVNQSLQSWKVPAHDFTPVTLKQLLSHSAGINVESVPGYRRGAPLPTLRQILDGLPPATNPPIRVERQPGQFAYSGGGATVVQQLIEDVSHQPFARALREQLFVPLGLTHTTFELLSSDQLACVDDHGNVLPLMVNPESAAAGLWSTPSDLALVLIELQRGLKGRSALFSQQLAQRVVTPVVPIVSAEDNDGVEVQMGLGAFLERRHGTLHFGHDGKNDGFLTIMRATERGDGVVIMSNGAGAGPLMLEVIRRIAAEYQWPGWND